MNETYRQITKKQHHKLLDKAISMYMPSLYNVDGKFDGQILQTKDKEQRKAINAYAHFLTRELLQKIDDGCYEVYKTKDLSDKPTIFIFWYQGLNDMPDINKRCIASIHQHCSNCDIRILTKNNLHSYINVDSNIQKAFDEKRMTIITFSDYVRLELLSTYNALWLDSTIYAAKDIDMSFFSNKLLFPKIDETTNVYSKSKAVSRMFLSSYNYIPSVYILGSQNSCLIQYAKHLFIKYFCYYDYAVNYFLIDDILEYLIDTYKECKSEWVDCPSNNTDVEQLMISYNTPEFAKKYVEQSDSCFYKLSYKTNKSKLMKIIDYLEQ